MRMIIRAGYTDLFSTNLTCPKCAYIMGFGGYCFMQMSLVVYIQTYKLCFNIRAGDSNLIYTHMVFIFTDFVRSRYCCKIQFGLSL